MNKTRALSLWQTACLAHVKPWVRELQSIFKIEENKENQRMGRRKMVAWNFHLDSKLLGKRSWRLK